jgi:lipopolysaccharide/colanic/teichoic acid biosynthesis glycosyltransferase
MVKVIDFQSIFKNGKNGRNGKPIQVFKSKDSTTQEHKDTHQQIEESKSI